MGQVRHRPDNITRPLIRKNGELVPVSWDDALDDVAVKLRKTIDTYGPDSIGMYFGSGLGIDSSGYAMMEAFYRALGTPPKFSPLTNDGTAKVMLAGAMAGTHAINPKTDYDSVELMIYVGTNPMVSHAHNTGMFNPGMWLKKINKRGGEIWTIDPVRTETVNYSAGHIAAYPGKDYAILAWITKELIDNGPLTPKQPVQGLERLRAVLEDYTRAKAAAIAGVTEQECQALLDAIRRRGRCSIETGTGITMSAGCNMTQFFAWTIMVLTGSMNARGGAWMHPGFLNQFEKYELPILDSAFSPGPKTRPASKGILGEWPCAVLPTEIEAGNIRALFNFGGHIIRSFPDTNALIAALGKLELNVDTEIAHNETTALSTHILPPKYGLERHEFTRWDLLNWNVSLQYSPPLVQPLGERRSAWWIISQFMRRAGLPVPAHVPESDLDPEADLLMLKKLMRNARCTFEELVEKRYVEFPLEFPADWVERHFQRLGGWRLAVPEIIGQWEQMRAQDEANLGRPRPLVYSSRRQRRKFNGQLDFLGAVADVILHPETAAERGIEDGQKVRVYNKAGEIFLTAALDPTMRRGVASISHGHKDANVNFLTSADDYDPLGGMALYSGVPIEIEPVACQESAELYAARR
jgi:anaerobic selenocysteine-containing dehydrogenase